MELCMDIDWHLVIIVLIMISSGGFGGYLNYLHNFDIPENEPTDRPL
jgi:hypothetical protein